MEASTRAPDDVRALVDQSATKLVEQANNGLKRISDKLRGKSLDELLRDAQSFAREQPVVFLGAAAGAGFLAARFLKSSQRDDKGS